MSNRFKIFTLCVACVLSLMSSVVVSAQDYYETKFLEPICATGDDKEYKGFVSNGTDQGVYASIVNGTATSWQVVSLKIEVLESDGTSTTIEELTKAMTTASNPTGGTKYIGCNNGYYLEYHLRNTGGTSSTRLGYSTFRLQGLSVNQNKAPQGCEGKTNRVTVKFASGMTLVYVYDLLKAPIAEYNGVDYSEEQGCYVYTLCEDEAFDVQMLNEDYPFGTEPTYNGYTYQASYSWTFEDENKNTTEPKYSLDKSLHVEGLGAKGTATNIYKFTPIATFVVYKDGVELGSAPCSSPLEAIVVQFDAKVDISYKLNGVNSNALRVCDGEYVTLTADFQKLFYGYTDYLTEGEAYLYIWNEEISDWEEIDYTGDLSDVTFELGKMVVVDKKNTTYKYKLASHDMTYNWGEADCWSEEVFTVTAIEKDAEITLPDGLEACEDGTVDITASVSGTSSSAYTYTWSGVDCSLNASPINTLTLSDKEIAYNGGKRTYRLTVSNEGCEIFKDVEVTTHERPILSAVKTPVEVCYDESVELEVSSSQDLSSYGVVIAWHENSEFGSNDGTPSADGLTNTIIGKNDKSYFVTAVNKFTCTTKTPAKIDVKVNTQPDIVAFPDVTLCEEGSATLNATVSGGVAPYEFTWTWTEGGTDYSEKTTSSSNIGSYLFTPTADITTTTTYDVTVSATDAKHCALGKPMTGKVTVMQTPEFTATPTEACDGESGTFTFSDNTLVYSVVSSNAPSGTTTSVSGDVCTVNFPLQDLTEVKEYEFEIKGNTTTTPSCENTFTFKMKVNPLPTVSAAVNDNDICLGMSVKLTATSNVADADAEYVWTDASNAIIGNGKSITYEPTSTGDLTYYVTVKNKSTTCTQKASVNVKVSSPEPLTITATKDAICEGESTVLSSSLTGTGYSYAWTPKTALNKSNVAQVTAKPLSTIAYHLVVTDKNSGCKSEADKTITVNNKPKFTATPNTEVCYGSNTTVTVEVEVTDGTASYITLEGGERKAVVAGKVNFDITQTWTTNPTVFKLTAENAECNYNDPADAVTVNVVVNTKPDAPVIPAPKDICAGEKTTLKISSPKSTYIYKWYSDAACATTPLFEGNGSAGATYNTDVLTVPTTFYVKSMLGDCESDVTPVTVNVIAYPAVPVIETPSSTLCSADAALGVTLNVKDPLTGLTYTWKNSADDSVVGTGTSISVTPSETVSYYVTATNATGCESDPSSPVVLTINITPEISETLYDKTICQNDEIVLEITSVGENLQYHWSVDEYANLDNTSIKISSSSVGTNKVTVYAINTVTSCKSDEIEFEYVANKIPSYTIAPADRNVCEGDDITISATTDAADPLLTWGYKKEGPVALVWTNNPLTFTPEVDTEYYIDIYDIATGCSVTESFELNVYAKPNVAVEGNTTVCTDNAIDITITSTDLDASTYTYEWVKDGVSKSTSNKLTKAHAELSDAGDYTVTISNAKGCSTEVHVTLVVNDYALTEIVGDDYVCLGGTVALEAADKTMKSYSWVATVDGSTVATTTTYDFSYDASALAAGKKIIVTLDYEDDYCVGKQLTQTVTVRELPTVASVDNLAYCLVDAGDMNLTANLANPVAGSTYKYYWSYNGGAPVETTTNVYSPVVALTAEGSWSVYAVEYIGDKLICKGNELPFNVDVFDFEVSLDITEAKFCKDSGDALNVNASVTTDEDASLFTYDYVLTDASDNVVDSKSAAGDSYSYASVSTLDLGVYTLTVTAHSPFGCSKKAEVLTVTVVESPSKTLTTSPACIGSAITFVADANADKWEFFVDGASQGVQTSNTFTMTGLAENTEVYAVLSLASCSVTSETQQVHYFATFEPTADFSSYSQVCENAIVPYTIASTTLDIKSYQVMVSKEGNPFEFVEEVVLETPSKTAQYKYKDDVDYSIKFVVTSVEGCVSETNDLAPVMSHIAINNVATDDDNTDFCVGQTYNVKVTTSGAIQAEVGGIVGVDMNYVIISDEAGSVASAAADVTNRDSEYTFPVTFTTPGDHSIEVLAIDLNGFCNDSYTYYVTVHELPEATITPTSHTPTSANIYEPCDGESFVFNVSNAAFTLNLDGVDVTDLAVAGFEVAGTTVTYSPAYPESHTIYVTVNDGFCDNKSNEVVVKPHAKITATYSTAEGPVDIDDSNLLMICEGDNITVNFAAADVTDNIALTLDGASAGNNSATVDAQVLGSEDYKDQILVASTADCSRTVTIRTMKAPKTAVEFTNADDNSIYVSFTGYTGNKICSDETINIKATGASRYTLAVKLDGADFTEFPESYDGSEFLISQPISYIENGTDYNEYELTYKGYVGTCEDDLVVSFRVYKNPEVTITPSASLVIAGTSVALTATPGYESYEFFVDGVSQAVQSGSMADKNIFKYTVADADINVSVIATTYYNCTDEDNTTVKVLEGLVPSDVVVSNDYYCSNDEGVTVSVLTPQEGITYVLNECATCEPIVYDGSNEVAWNNIRVLTGETTSTYSVKSFHASLPDESIAMNNTVTVTEVHSPVQFQLTPDRTDNRCDAAALIELSSSEVGVMYQLYFNGVELGAPLAGTGSPLEFIVADQIGKYEVFAYSQFLDAGGNLVDACKIKMLGTYRIDVPLAAEFSLVDVNGNYCEDGDAIEIKLEGSEVGKVYKLLRDGVVVLDSESNEVAVDGTGSEISFGSYAVDGKYTVVCFFDGCNSPMAGEVNLKKWARPATQVVTLANYGHYCSDEKGGVVTVGSQEEGYLYTLYNGDEVVYDDSNVAYSYIGNATGDSFTWTDVPQGTYTIKITIPVVDSGCETVLDAFTLVKDEIPAEAVIRVTDANGVQDVEATICQDDYATINIYNTQAGVLYELLRDGALVDSRVDDTEIHSFNFENIGVGGLYSVRATVTYDLGDGKFTSCVTTFDETVKVTVVARPAGSATLDHEMPADKLAADPCYGEDVIVKDATPGFIYKIYRVEGSDEYPMNDYTFTAVGDPEADRFFNIKTNNGTFKVYVSNGSCEDPVGTVTLVNTKYVDPQTVIGDKSMCQGDEGLSVGLAGAEAGVTYRLYGPSLTTPEEHTATAAEVATGFFFNSLMIQEGVYYVTGANASGCEIKMYPEVDFKVYPLPVSFELNGNSAYCDEEGSVLSLSGSEIGVEYTLYSKAADDVLSPIETIIGTGKEIKFKPVKVGTYEASARNTVTKCTSSMLGEPVIIQRPAIDKLGIGIDPEKLIVRSCSEKTISLTDNLTADATYYLVKGSASPADGFVKSVLSDGISPVKFALVENGKYTIYGAYGDDYSCLTAYATIDFSMEPLATFPVEAEANCDGTASVILSDYEKGVDYFVQNHESITSSVVGGKLVWTIPTTGGTETFTVIGSVDACESVIGQASATVLPDVMVDQITVTNCDDSGDGKFVLLGEDLFYGATYYLVKGNADPATGSLEFHRYTGSNLEFTLKETGTYSVYATLNNECFMEVYAVLFNTRKINTNFKVAAEQSCDGKVTITMDGSQPGVVYTLNGANKKNGTGSPIVWNLSERPTEVVFLNATVGSCDINIATLAVNSFVSETFDNVKVDVDYDCENAITKFSIADPQDDVDYTLYVDGVAQEKAISWTINNGGKALYKIEASNASGCVPFIVFAETIDYSKVKALSVADIKSCEAAYTLKISANIESNVTYYLVDASASAPQSDSQAQVTDGIVPLQFLLDADGDYKIIATRNNGCFNDVASFNFQKTVIATEDVVVSATVDCDGSAKVNLDNAQDGVTYKLSGVEGTAVGSTITWNVSKDVTSKLIAYLGNCEEVIDVIRPSDFKSSTFADAEVTAEGGCAGSVTVVLSAIESGVDYTLYIDGLAEPSYIHSDGVWIVDIVGTHVFSVKASNGSCEFMYNDASATSTAAITMADVYLTDDDDNVITAPTCPEIAANLIIKASSLVNGVTYDVYKLRTDNVEKPVGKPFVYDGSAADKSFRIITLGTYIVRATTDDCVEKVAEVSYNIHGLSDVIYSIDATSDCDGNGEAIISISNTVPEATYTFLGANTKISDYSWKVTEPNDGYAIKAELDGCSEYIDNISVQFEKKTKPSIVLTTNIDGKTYTGTVTPNICKSTSVVFEAVSDVTDVNYTFYVNGVEKQNSTSSTFKLNISDVEGVVTVSAVATAVGSDCPSEVAATEVVINPISIDGNIYFADVDENNVIIASTVNETVGTVDDPAGRVVVENAQPGIAYTLVHKGVELETKYAELYVVPEIPAEEPAEGEEPAEPVVPAEPAAPVYKVFFGPINGDVEAHPGEGIGDYYVKASNGECSSLYGPVTFTELTVAIITKEVVIDCQAGTIVKVTEPKAGWKYSIACADNDITLEPITAGSGEVAWTITEPLGVHSMVITAVKGNSQMATEPFNVEVNGVINVLADFDDQTDCNEVVIDLNSVASESAKLTEGVTYELVAEDGAVYAIATKDHPTFTLTTTGKYTIWARGASDVCDLVVSHVNFYRPSLEGETVVADASGCSDKTTIRVVNPVDGTKYFSDQLGEAIVSEDGIYWIATGNNVATYTFYADKEGCKIAMNSVEVDFTASILPDTKMIMLLNGDQEDKDNVEICPSSRIWFYGDTNNSIVSSYGFKLYKQYTEDGVVKTKVVDDTFSKVNAGFIYKPTNFTNGDTIVVVMSAVMATGCPYDSIASRTLYVKNSTLPGERLYVKEDINEYCEGESGLTLAFKDVDKGITYRLFKYTDPYEKVTDLSEINVDSLDLVDVQELPDYFGASHAAEIIFNGWSFNGTTYNKNATNGFYFVTLKTDDGCDATSNIVEIVQNPLPFSDNDTNVDSIPNVYFAAGNVVDGSYVIAEDTKNPEYGLLDNGFVVFENAHKGYKYELVHLSVANGEDYVLQTIDDVNEGQTLYFGPIVSDLKKVISTTDENGVTVSADSVNVMGIGDYTIRVTDMTHATECQNDLGYLTFIDEELTTYDVFIYLNSDDSSHPQPLIPGYGHKGNHKFLDWSTAIDKVYLPEYETAMDGSSTVTSDLFIEKFGPETGYSSLRGNLSKDANIVFEWLDNAEKVYVDEPGEGIYTDRDSITVFDNYVKGCNVDTLYSKRVLDKYEDGCDSTYVSTGYEYFKVYDDNTKIKVDKLTAEDFDNPNYKVDSVSIGGYQYYVMDPIYKYWKPVYYKYVSLRDIYDGMGNWGFDDFDGTTDLHTSSKTGLFVYRKPSNTFYGEIKIPYRAYNEKMRNLRYSNISYITILCGNETVPGDSVGFLMPNAISPNGDGFNDEFIVTLPPSYEECHSSYLEVFNRWGTLVYRSSGSRYGRDCPNWDGTSKTSNMLTVGEQLPQGTYFYVFTINFNVDNKVRTKKLNGYIELRR
ncbi:MAG: gliding motility-associated C-terminal domain-containing protein [Bacteroidales bacterium]|nr:gliding motility-associated C-terminal domain-containing protein [Bacteroidales bacterium]